MDDSLDIVLAQPSSSPSPKVELYLKGDALTGHIRLTRDSTKGQAGEIHGDFDFPTQILTKKESGDSVVYADFTSRIGKAKTTTFYRWLPDSATNHPDKPGHYVILKRDSTGYSHVAPSLDRRFIADADTGRVGRFKEVWSYTRVRKCDSTGTDSTVTDCNDQADTSQWAKYKTAPRHKTVTVVRYPTYLVMSQTQAGFNGSRQPGDSGFTSGTDFIVTSVTNHFFDPLTGQPTLTVAHAGPYANSPSKVTRVTPAYLVDTNQSVTDLPMLMFAKNNLEATFREDAFTFKDATPATDFNSQSLFSGVNGENGGTLASRLTAVKVTPYRQWLLYQKDGLPYLDPDTSGVASVTQPIGALGAFTPRFDLSLAQDSIGTNRSRFTTIPNLKSWQGNRLIASNRYLKALETKDVYGRSTSNRFDPRGLHQIGLFGNAPYSETAVLTPEGYAGGLTSGDWTFPTALPVLSKGYLTFSAPFGMQQPFELNPASSYVVECQLFTPEATSVTFKFQDAGLAIWGTQTLTTHAGMGYYRVVLDNALWKTSPPSRGSNSLWMQVTTLPKPMGVKFLRAYPKEAEAMSYVYDERGNLRQSVNVAGVSTYFEYDLFGKLIAIRNDDGVMLTSGSREQTNQ